MLIDVLVLMLSVLGAAFGAWGAWIWAMREKVPLDLACLQCQAEGKVRKGCLHCRNKWEMYRGMLD